MSTTEERLQFLQLELEEVHKLKIFAHPIVPLQSETTGEYFELLSRFYDGHNSIMNPEPIFKSASGHKARALDYLVLEKAFEAIEQRQNSSNPFNPNFRAAVNVSKSTIKTPDMYFKLLNLHTEKIGLSPKNMVLELTEEVNEGLLNFTRTAIQSGYKVSIDDFLSSQSSPGKIQDLISKLESEQLKNLTLKLDRTFIRTIEDPNARFKAYNEATLKAFIAIKKDIPELTLVTEGVENQVMAQKLQKLGIDYGQGWFWAQPTILNEYKHPKFIKNY